MNLAHFKKEEHGFIVRMEDLIHQVYEGYQLKTTKFLTPREQEIVQMLVNEFSDVEVQWIGGFKNAERKRAILIPTYLNDQDFSYTVIGYEVRYAHKMVDLRHPQVLGTIMSLGIERQIIGDILILADKRIFLAVCEEMAPFIEQALVKVGRHSISLAKKKINELERIETYERREIIVSSMRLDVIVCALTKESRSFTSESIKQGNIQHNFKVEQNHSKECHIGDMISIKRYGRYKLLEIKSQTKSGRKIVIVGKVV